MMKTRWLSGIERRSARGMMDGRNGWAVSKARSCSIIISRPSIDHGLAAGGGDLLGGAGGELGGADGQGLGQFAVAEDLQAVVVAALDQAGGAEGGLVDDGAGGELGLQV